MALTKNEKEEKYKYYLERHRIHEKWHESLSHNLDKLILGLSSGTLILSVTFIDKIIGLGKIQNLCLIKMSWMFLSITLIANVITYIFSIEASVNSRKVLKNWLDSDQNGTPKTYNWLGKTANGLNIFSLFTLSIGIFLLTHFAITNLDTINTMNNNKQEEQKEKVEKALSPQTEPEFIPSNSDKEEKKEVDEKLQEE